MTVTLDDATEKLLQRELERGHFTSPSELIAHALDLVEAEHDALVRHRRELLAGLDESVAQAERGEVYTEEQIRARMAARRANAA